MKIFRCKRSLRFLLMGLIWLWCATSLAKDGKLAKGLTGIRPIPFELGRWQPLQKGLSYMAIKLKVPAQVGDRKLHVLKIDPKVTSFRVLLRKQLKWGRQEPRAVLSRYQLAAAINVGMYQQDYRSHVGYLKHRGKVVSRSWHRRFFSVLVLGPRRKGLPKAAILDVDHARGKKRMRQYQTVIQNLRLIKQVGRRGRSVWGKKRKRAWSESLMAMDRQGMLYMMHTRTPFTMARLTRMLLRLPWGIVRAMHLDGGAPAGFSLKSAKHTLHMAGSYYATDHEQSTNHRQFPIPNILGIKLSR